MIVLFPNQDIRLLKNGERIASNIHLDVGYKGNSTETLHWVSQLSQIKNSLKSITPSPFLSNEDKLLEMLSVDHPRSVQSCVNSVTLMEPLESLSYLWKYAMAC